jgi:hypothetical protein
MPNDETLMQRDPLVDGMVTIENDEGRAMTPFDLARPILMVELPNEVPFEVRRAFYMARNAMAYGYWYWPLVTMGAQQILRVADFATDVAWNTTKSPNFKERVEKLIKRRVIDGSDANLWECVRDWRNKATHPEWQQTWGPKWGVKFAQTVAGVAREAEMVAGG